MKFLLLLALTLTFSTSSALECLLSCNQECGKFANILPLPFWKSFIEGLCTPKCVRDCTCLTPCQADCDKTRDECVSEIIPVLSVVCSVQSVVCKSVFCTVKCAINQLLPPAAPTVIPGISISTAAPPTPVGSTVTLLQGSSTTVNTTPQEVQPQINQPSSNTPAPFFLGILQLPATASTSQASTPAPFLIPNLFG